MNCSVQLMGGIATFVFVTNCGEDSIFFVYCENGIILLCVNKKKTSFSLSDFPTLASHVKSVSNFIPVALLPVGGWFFYDLFPLFISSFVHTEVTSNFTLWLNQNKTHPPDSQTLCTPPPNLDI